jgi:MFS family permease
MTSLGISPLPYVLLGELFTTNVKGLAVSVASVYGAALGFVVGKFFDPLSNIWGKHSMFWIFGSCCILGCIFMLVVLPETKGKSFPEIQSKINKRGQKR